MYKVKNCISYFLYINRIFIVQSFFFPFMYMLMIRTYLRYLAKYFLQRLIDWQRLGLLATFNL